MLHQASHCCLYIINLVLIAFSSMLLYFSVIAIIFNLLSSFSIPDNLWKQTPLKSLIVKL
jgi:hypothetical protein